MTSGRLPPTCAQLTDLEKSAIRLRGGDPEKQEDVDKFFILTRTTRRKWKQAVLTG